MNFIALALIFAASASASALPQPQGLQPPSRLPVPPPPSPQSIKEDSKHSRNILTTLNEIVKLSSTQNPPWEIILDKTISFASDVEHFMIHVGSSHNTRTVTPEGSRDSSQNHYKLQLGFCIQYLNGKTPDNGKIGTKGFKPFTLNRDSDNFFLRALGELVTIAEHSRGQ